MKKNLLFATLLSTALLLSACTADTTEASTSTTNQDTTVKLSVVASSYYQYDWLCEILGEEQGNVELTLLMDDGVDLHSYEPSVADIATISSADMFLYTGGESDTWVDDVIAQAMNEDLVSLNMSEILSDRVLAEVAVEGMQETEHDHGDEEESDDHDHDDTEEADDHDHDDTEESDDHDHDDTEEADDHDHDDAEEADDHDHDDAEEADDHDHEEEEAEQDEHVWLSLKNAMIICDVLADQLGQLDPEHADLYRTNADAYIASLDELSSSYETMVAEAPRDTILFADRFPFLYLVSDYDIQYYAAFQGCSAETEASFETIAFLADKVGELNLNYVIIIDNGLEELAATVVANSENPDCEVLVLDSMQSTTSTDGATYYTVMEKNLEILALALGE